MKKMSFIGKAKSLFFKATVLFAMGAGTLSAETAERRTEIVRVGEERFSLMHCGDKRWVVGVSRGAHGNSVSVLYFHKADTPDTAMENSLPSCPQDKKEIILSGTAQWLKALWRSVGEDVNPYAFENLRVTEKNVFDGLLFGGMPFSVTDEGHFKISGVFPAFWCTRGRYGLWAPENTFDFVYDDDAGTWINVSDGLREEMPMTAEASAEDWIGYSIERKTRGRKNALPLPEKYDPARAEKLFKRNSLSSRVRKQPSSGRAELPGNEGFVRGNGKTVFWKRYKAQDRIYLFSESEEEAATAFPRSFDKNFRQQLEADGVPVPAKVREVAFPFQSKKALRLERIKPFISENGNFAFSAKVCGYDFSFEYDAAVEKWRNLPDGDFLAEPESGEIPETLWLLHVLKKRGALDGLSPENYPVFLGMIPVPKHGELTVKNAMEMLREREKILREAVIKEFGEE